MKNVLILILSCSDPVYQKLASDGINKTWNSTHLINAPTLYYEGGHNELYHDDSTIYLTEPDDYASITRKTLQAFRYAINNFDFDYIFRTNSSSYIHKTKLLDWLSDKPTNNFYSGVIGEYGDTRYAAGSGYTISKNLVKLIVDNPTQLDINYIDDVALGKFLNIPIFPAPRKDLYCVTNRDYEIGQYFHYRCKCSDDRNIDIQHMHNIHKLFNSSY